MRGAFHPGPAMPATAVEHSHHGSPEQGAVVPALPAHLMAAVRSSSTNEQFSASGGGRAATTMARRAADPPGEHASGEHAGASVTSGDTSLKRGFPEEQPMVQAVGEPRPAAQAKARLPVAPGVDFLATAVMAVEAANAANKGHSAEDPPWKRGRLATWEDDAAATRAAAGMMRAHGTRSWDECFGALLKFHARHGHCNITADNCPGDVALILWVSNQRTQKLYLTTEQRCKLDMLGFCWDNNNTSVPLSSIHPAIPAGHSTMSAAHFRTPASHLPARNIFNVLEQYTQRHPLPTPTILQTSEERKSHPVCSQKERLNDSGGDDETYWNSMHQTLQGFQKARGHCRISPDLTLGDQKFSDWAIQQRDLFRRKLLPQDRYAKLQAIGFEWGATQIGVSNPVINTGKKGKVKKNTKNDKNDPARKRIRSFEENFQALIQYKKEHGRFCFVLFVSDKRVGGDKLTYLMHDYRNL